MLIAVITRFVQLELKHFKRSACLPFRINMWFNEGELMKKLLLIGLGLVMLMASFGYAADEPAKAPTAVPAPPVA